MHLHLLVLLKVQLLLELVELAPEVPFVPLDGRPVGLELLHLSFLLALLLVKLGHLGVHLGQFFLESLALFLLFRVLLALQLAHLQLQILL